MLHLLYSLRIVAILLLPTLANAQDSRQHSEPFEQVEQALNLYVKEGPSAVVRAWLKGSPMESSNEGLKHEAFLYQVESAHGKPEGFEILNRISPSARTRVLVFAVNYQTGSMFGRAQMYQTSAGNWITQVFMFHTDAGLMYPGSMQVRQ